MFLKTSIAAHLCCTFYHGENSPQYQTIKWSQKYKNPRDTIRSLETYRLYSPIHCLPCLYQTFRMMNVRPVHKTMRNGPDSLLGFPLLEELCIATTSYSYTTDKELWEILFGSTKLRVLDLRGCSRITPNGLAALPCSGRL